MLVVKQLIEKLLVAMSDPRDLHTALPNHSLRDRDPLFEDRYRGSADRSLGPM
jgi:hypothetical protein